MINTKLINKDSVILTKFNFLTRFIGNSSSIEVKNKENNQGYYRFDEVSAIEEYFVDKTNTLVIFDVTQFNSAKFMFQDYYYSNFEFKIDLYSYTGSKIINLRNIETVDFITDDSGLKLAILIPNSELAKYIFGKPAINLSIIASDISPYCSFSIALLPPPMNLLIISFLNNSNFKKVPFSSIAVFSAIFIKNV